MQTSLDNDLDFAASRLNVLQGNSTAGSFNSISSTKVCVSFHWKEMENSELAACPRPRSRPPSRPPPPLLLLPLPLALREELCTTNSALDDDCIQEDNIQS